jgi:hypothetical protein
MFLMRMTTSHVSQAFIKMLTGRGSTRRHTRGTLRGRQMLM